MKIELTKNQHSALICGLCKLLEDSNIVGEQHLIKMILKAKKIYLEVEE